MSRLNVTRRVPPFRAGRCDLWIADVKREISWACEFKQHFAAARIRQPTFDARLERARNDAKQLHKDGADRRVGCLIVVPGQSTLQTRDLIEHFDELCQSAHIAF
jgi:hypothetical protein